MRFARGTERRAWCSTCQLPSRRCGRLARGARGHPVHRPLVSTDNLAFPSCANHRAVSRPPRGVRRSHPKLRTSVKRQGRDVRFCPQSSPGSCQFLMRRRWTETNRTRDIRCGPRSRSGFSIICSLAASPNSKPDFKSCAEAINIANSVARRVAMPPLFGEFTRAGNCRGCRSDALCRVVWARGPLTCACWSLAWPRAGLQPRKRTRKGVWVGPRVVFSALCDDSRRGISLLHHTESLHAA